MCQLIEKGGERGVQRIVMKRRKEVSHPVSGVAKETAVLTVPTGKGRKEGEAIEMKERRGLREKTHHNPRGSKTNVDSIRILKYLVSG